MSSVAALQSSDVTKIGIGVIVALVVIGLLISLVVTAIIGRLVVLVVVVVLAALVWQQRTSIEDKIDKFKAGEVSSCQFDKSFFGVTVKAPASLVQECQQHLQK